MLVFICFSALGAAVFVRTVGGSANRQSRVVDMNMMMIVIITITVCWRQSHKHSQLHECTEMYRKDI